MLPTQLIQFSLVVTALWLGGWEWAITLVAAMLFSHRHSKVAISILQLTAVSVAWLAYYAASGDRRMFFPFTLQLAVQVSFLPDLKRPLLAATSIIALFSAIRLIQSASLIVLTVELLVAAVAIAVPVYIYRHGPPSAARRLIFAALGSLIAFAGLVF